MTTTAHYGAGDVYIGFYDAVTGNFVAYENQAYNVTALSIEYNEGETAERVSRKRLTFRQVLDSISIAGAPTLSITTDDVTAEIMALALDGNSTSISVTQAAFTDQAVTAVHDKWVPIGSHLNLLASPAPVVTDSGGSTTYTDGIDYEINTRLSMIKAMSTGSITDGQSLLVDGTVRAIQGYRVDGFSNRSAKCRVLYDGKNLASGESVRLEVLRVPLRPADATDFQAAGFLAPSFSGLAETPDGATSPVIYHNLGATND